MNFRYRFMQFMSGRYGMDKFNIFLFICAIVVSVINVFLRTLFWRIAIFYSICSILQIVVYAVIGYAIFRFLSRNIEARRRENYWFEDKLSFFNKQYEIHQKQKNDKTHIYRKCPSCKAILRLPYRIGNHTTVCPRCNKEFKVKVRK